MLVRPKLTCFRSSVLTREDKVPFHSTPTSVPVLDPVPFGTYDEIPRTWIRIDRYTSGGGSDVEQSPVVNEYDLGRRRKRLGNGLGSLDQVLYFD